MGNVREECSGEMWSEVSLTVKTARQREFSVAQTGKRNEMVSPFSLTKYIMTHLHTFSCCLSQLHVFALSFDCFITLSMSFMIVLLVLPHAIENRCTIKHSLLMVKQSI